MMQAPNIGEVVLHHTADAYSFGLGEAFPSLNLHWERWPDLHLGPLTLNLTPTKHVIFLMLAALLVFLTMWVAGRKLEKQRAGERAPAGFANAIEAMVLFVRDEIAIANIGHGGEKFAPYIMTLFFFILGCNLMGMLPWSGSPTAGSRPPRRCAILE